MAHFGSVSLFGSVSFAAVVATTWAFAAQAQTLDQPPEAAIPSPAQTQLGPADFGGEVVGAVVNATQVDLSANVIYDDNVSRSSGTLAAGRGLNASDVIFQPTIALNLARVFGRESAFIRGTLGYDFYDRNTQLNRENIDLSGGVNAQVLRCQEGVDVNYSRLQSDLADQAIGLVNNTRQDITVGGSVGCGGAIGLAPSASVTQTWITNSNALARTADSNTLAGTASLAYRRPSFGTISVFGSYSETTFPNQPLPTLGPIQDYNYNVYAGGVAVNRRVGARIEANASISYSVLQSNAPGAGSFSGLTYSGDLTYHATSRLSADAFLSRSTNPSNRIGSNFSVNETYGLNINYSASNRLSFNLRGARSSSNYNSLTTGPAFDLTRATTYNVGASAYYRLNRLLRLSINVQDIESTANFVGLSYSDQRVTLGATSSF